MCLLGSYELSDMIGCSLIAVDKVLFSQPNIVDARGVRKDLHILTGIVQNISNHKFLYFMPF